MGEADCGVGRVDALAAFAGGAVNVHADVGFVELDVDVFGDLGDHIDSAKRRVTALVGIERADAHEAVDAALGLGVAVGVFAFDQDGGFADAGGVAGLHVHELDGVIAPLGPAGIHAKHDIGPVVGLGATGAGLDGEDGVVAVELAGEEGGDLELVEFSRERGEGAGELLVVGFLGGGVFAGHELVHHHQVIELLLIGDDREDSFLEPVEFRDVFLGAIVAVPKSRVAHLGVHRLYFTLLLIAVKETSIDARRAS